MTHEDVLSQLKQEFDAKRHQSLRQQEERTAQVCSVCPEIKQLLDARSDLLMGGIRKMLMDMQNQSAPCGVDIQSDLDHMTEQIHNKLLENGFPMDYLQPVYQCDRCKDQGYIYTPGRQMCDCMKKELIQRDLARVGIDENGPSFDKFSLEYYDDDEAAAVISPRKLAEVALKVCKNFSDEYPEQTVKNILITGTSGLGKTYLMQCMARRFMERLISVEIISAYRLIEAARDAWFDHDDASMDSYLEAPLLMIDDLGTEPLFNNITVTQLFNLLNERASKGLSTIISTNLKMSELQERYTERVASRLQDPKSWRYLHLEGKDIRKVRKRGENEI